MKVTVPSRRRARQVVPVIIEAAAGVGIDHVVGGVVLQGPKFSSSRHGRPGKIAPRPCVGQWDAQGQFQRTDRVSVIFWGHRDCWDRRDCQTRPSSFSSCWDRTDCWGHKGCSPTYQLWGPRLLLSLWLWDRPERVQVLACSWRWPTAGLPSGWRGRDVQKSCAWELNWGWRLKGGR